VQGIWKAISAGQGPQRQWVYSVAYHPSSEHRAARARDLETAKKGEKERDLEKAKNLELAGRYEEAAQEYERLGMFEKAGMARREARVQYVISTNFQIGKNGVISIACPHCGGSQPIESKTSEITCKYCGKAYIIPRKILDMI
jgi:ribosomal protein S27E